MAATILVTGAGESVVYEINVDMRLLNLLRRVSRAVSRLQKKQNGR